MRSAALPPREAGDTRCVKCGTTRTDGSCCLLSTSAPPQCVESDAPKRKPSEGQQLLPRARHLLLASAISSEGGRADRPAAPRSPARRHLLRSGRDVRLGQPPEPGPERTRHTATQACCPEHPSHSRKGWRCGVRSSRPARRSLGPTSRRRTGPSCRALPAAALPRRRVQDRIVPPHPVKVRHWHVLHLTLRRPGAERKEGIAQRGRAY